MNIVGMILLLPIKFLLVIPMKLLKDTQFRKIVFNDAYAKLLIIFGVLKWFDLPHLHHPLIYLRISIEERNNLR